MTDCATKDAEDAAVFSSLYHAELNTDAAGSSVTEMRKLLSASFPQTRNRSSIITTRSWRAAAVLVGDKKKKV